MAIVRYAFAGFLKSLIGPVLAVSAAVSLIQPANAMLISIDTTSATLECTGGAAVPCAGLASADPYSADLYSLISDNPTLEAATLDSIEGTTFTSGTQHAVSNSEAYTFATNVAYFMIKMASGEAFFRNETGGMIYLSFLANGTENALRYITTFGDGTLSQTPLPAALPLFSSALALLGFIGWRRRKVA